MMSLLSLRIWEHWPKQANQCLQWKWSWTSPKTGGIPLKESNNHAKIHPKQWTCLKLLKKSKEFLSTNCQLDIHFRFLSDKITFLCVLIMTESQRTSQPTHRCLQLLPFACISCSAPGLHLSVLSWRLSKPPLWAGWRVRTTSDRVFTAPRERS